MKDPHDKATSDLIDKPRRGRPSTGKAKTQAQIQREYRARKKTTMQHLPTLAQALSGFEVWHLPKGCRKWRKMTDYPLSWDSAHYFVRCFELAHGIVDADLPDLATKYEIRPLDFPYLTSTSPAGRLAASTPRLLPLIALRRNPRSGPSPTARKAPQRRCGPLRSPSRTPV